MQIFKKIIIWALMLESRLILRKYKPFIIAVTGSVGKTSTKDAIYDVLKDRKICDERHICFVRKSDKSFNSEIGLPLTVIGVPNAWRSASGWLDNISAGWRLIWRRREYPDCLILELGADHPGDIRKVAKWLRPDVAVITRVSRTPVHVEFFSSPEEVFEEKASLATAVKPGGTVILFGDDDRVLSIRDRVKDKGVSVVSFGLSETADVRAVNFNTVYEGSAPTGLSFDLSMDGISLPVLVKGIIGQSFAYTLLAAAAVGRVCGVEQSSIARALSGYIAPKGRMNVIPGINNSTIIDDTYNSSPDAARAALAALQAINTTGSKIAVLGDMMELGKYTADEHRDIGREAAKVAGIILAVGPRSHQTAEEAMKHGLSADSVRTFDSATEAAEYLKGVVKQGDLILVKGSQSIRMERVTKALMASPERAGELLCRQEQEWLEKA